MTIVQVREKWEAPRQHRVRRTVGAEGRMAAYAGRDKEFAGDFA
jgi:hypothetical protein